MNPGDARRLLVVDDEPFILDAVATSLRYKGFEVDTAATGRAALHPARKTEPDLIVLDVFRFAGPLSNCAPPAAPS